MSLVFDVPVGPTTGVDVSSPSAYVSSGAAQDKQGPVVAVPCFPLNGHGRAKPGFCPTSGESGKPESSSSSSESSSIGVPTDSDENEEEVEVESKSNGSLGSLGFLEESLPIKRGLSNYFHGKSKSFANLSDVNTVKEMEKRENPLNKRRRIMIAFKWNNKSSLFNGWKNPTSMPLLTLNEEDIQEEEEDDESSKEEEEQKLHHRKQQLKGF